MFETHLGQLAALGTACCWTVTALAFESASKRIGSLAVNLIRLFIAFGFLTIFCAIQRGQALPLDASQHTWLWLAISGLVGFSLGDLCLFRAFVLVGSRISMLIMALVPLMCALTGWALMDERLTGQDWLGMAITIAGVVWVILERRREDSAIQRSLLSKGIALALLGALGQAVGLVLSKYGMRDYDPFAATQIRVLAGMVGFGVIFSFIGWWPKVAQAFKDRGAIARTSLGAFFGPFLGVSLSLAAVQYIETGVAATIMSIVPVLILAPAALLFKDRITRRAVLGAVLAVSGVALLFLELPF
jgi:drug/metabolite transporter (DMT)-like permease